MTRIDRPRLLDCPTMHLARFPIRFDDLDRQNHVNNAAVVVLLQEARVGLNRAAGLPDIGANLRVMVAALHVEYVGEISFPGEVEIGTGVLALGRTSFTIGQVVRQDSRPSVFSEVVMVIADATGPIPLPDALRESYGRFLIG